MRAAELVYVNTVVADYLLAARFFSAKTIVHVHEIPDGAKLALFRRLLRWTRAEVIFNSKATRAAYALPAAWPQQVVYNGIATPADASSTDYDGKRPLRLLMLGRINRIKGQDLLIEALARLPEDVARRIDVRIVGDTFENDIARVQALHAAVHDTGLVHRRFEPFQADPAPLYRWADVVVVPSSRPAALGRVAIEAMAHRRPPLVAAIGGLPEIVEDRVSGWIVAPNDALALADALTQIVTRPADWRGYGEAGHARFGALFAAPIITRQLQSIVRARLNPRGGKPAPRGFASAQ